MKELPEQSTAILPHSPSLALTDLTRFVHELALPARSGLLYDADTLVDHIETLVTDSIDHIHALCRALTPDMYDSLTDRCQMVASLSPLAKQSPQLKRYPETVGKTIIEGLEHLCLEFHRQLYQLFPSEYQLPHSYLKMEVANASRQYQRLLSQYPRNKLLKAMLRPVNKFVHHTVANSTKRCIDYNNVLLSNIRLWQRKSGTQDELYEIALTMNLNCPRFMHHMASEAGCILQSFEKSADKSAYIGQLQKLFLHASTSTKWKTSAYGAYLPGTHSVSTHVQQWLSNQSNLVKLDVAESNGPSESDRIEMEVDATFFSVLFRIMIAAGLTKLKKFAPLFRSVCRFISFEKSVEPSSAYLIRLASNRVSSAVLDKVEAFFEGCAALVRKIKRNGGKFPEEVE